MSASRPAAGAEVLALVEFLGDEADGCGAADAKAAFDTVIVHTAIRAVSSGRTRVAATYASYLTGNVYASRATASTRPPCVKPPLRNSSSSFVQRLTRKVGTIATINMLHKPTQHERILSVLESLQRSDCDIPSEYIRPHSTGNGISSRYFKQVMLISEVNGRLSELKSKGYDIETSKEKDRYGFAYHRLKPAAMYVWTDRAKKPLISRAAMMCQLFDAGAPADQIFAV